MKNFLLRFLVVAILCSALASVTAAQDKLNGTTGVSPTGGATYSVPIAAPKGVGDLIPSVSIVYNSQTGNGLAGYGCNISSLSVITRGVKDVVHDGIVAGVNYDGNSALYLDGKRLLPKSGTAGADGCVYAPEGEPMTSVTLHGSLSNTACWFETDTNDGMVYEYGHSDGRQLLSNPSAVAAWYISKGTNALGQVITYQYSADGLYTYPQTITYGGGNTINFSYEARTDTISFVLRNQRGYIGKRLKSITTKAASSTFRTYTLTYDTASDGSMTKFSRLTNIKETGANGSTEHKLSVNWNYLPGFVRSTTDIEMEFPDGGAIDEYLSRYLTSCDVNGDGHDDLVHIATVKRHIGNGYSYKTYIQIYPNACSMGNVEYKPYLTYMTDGTYSNAYRNRITAGTLFYDIDGDGLKDIVLPQYTEDGVAYITWTIIFGKDIKEERKNVYNLNPYYLQGGSQLPLYVLQDFNNDGMADILYLEKCAVGGKYYCRLIHQENTYWYTATYQFTLSSTPQHLFTSDFNHDGLMDIMVVCNDGCRIFYNQGGALGDNTFVDSSTLNTEITTHSRLETGDFNGDGELDFLWNENDSPNLYFEIANGSGNYTRRLATTLDFAVREANDDNGTWKFMVTDLDLDGKSDIVLNLAEYVHYGNINLVKFHKSHCLWFLSDGSSLTKKKEATSLREHDGKANYIFLTDSKGQGVYEVANYGYDCFWGSDANTEPALKIYANPAHSVSNGKATSFTDSDGRTTAFTYASLAKDTVYTRGTSSKYPVADIMAPLAVTAKVRESGGSAISSENNYAYAGLRVHQNGRGLLGFREMTISELNTGRTVKKTSSNDNSLFYVPMRSTVATTQDGTTAVSVSDVTVKTFIYGSGYKNYAIYPTTQTDTDIYGNVTTVTRSYDMDKGVLLSERTDDDRGSTYRKTAYTYGNSKTAGAWRPVRITQEQQHAADSSPFTTRTDISYNNYGQQTAVTEAANTTMPLTTTYLYDSNGNVTQKTLSGSGIASGSTTSYQYGSDGKFVTQMSTAAAVTCYSRDAFGNVMAETDLTNVSNPLVTTYTRNGFGTLTKEVKPTGETTTWMRTASTDYASAYRIKTMTTGQPQVMTWYDALGNEVRTETTGVDNVKISQTTTYNTRGEITEKVMAHGDLTTTETYTYDGLGRVTSLVSSNGTSVTYGYGNRMVSTTKNGRSYTKTYDAWGNVVSSADPVSSVVYTYHSNGKPKAIQNGEQTVTMDYDARGNHTALNDPDAGVITYEYDALGRTTKQTDARGYVSLFQYDAAGRMTGKTVNGTTTSYSYGTSGNGTGRLTSEQKGDCIIQYGYDDKGRLEQETRVMNGTPVATFGYSYDQYGRLASKTYPQGVTISYVYDNGICIASTIDSLNVCLTTVDNGLKTVRSVGGVIKYVSPKIDITPPITWNSHGGMASTQGRDPLEPIDPIPHGPLDSVKVWDENPLERYEYYYAQNSVLTHTAEYDSRGFLTKLSSQKDSMLFVFQSGTGNLLERSGMSPSKESFVYDDLDRLVQANGTTQQNIAYSNNGNIVAKTRLGIFSYASSHPHAVTAVQNPLGSIASVAQTATYTPFGKINQ